MDFAKRILEFGKLEDPKFVGASHNVEKALNVPGVLESENLENLEANVLMYVNSNCFPELRTTFGQLYAFSAYKHYESIHYQRRSKKIFRDLKRLRELLIESTTEQIVLKRRVDELEHALLCSQQRADEERLRREEEEAEDSDICAECRVCAHCGSDPALPLEEDLIDFTREYRRSDLLPKEGDCRMTLKIKIAATMAEDKVSIAYGGVSKTKKSYIEKLKNGSFYEINHELAKKDKRAKSESENKRKKRKERLDLEEQLREAKKHRVGIEQEALDADRFLSICDEGPVPPGTFHAEFTGTAFVRPRPMQGSPVSEVTDVNSDQGTDSSEDAGDTRAQQPLAIVEKGKERSEE